MAPVQNTFCIVPNAPAAVNGGSDDSSRPVRPPMTTKQAKKAYQKANKAPKLSKAERRRQELFEQDRIRREFEKEKSQARARAARDKKRDKEEKERAEKKKKGLPLVNVRPSQDTLARFMRPAKPRDAAPTSNTNLEDDDTHDDDEPGETCGNAVASQYSASPRAESEAAPSQAEPIPSSTSKPASRDRPAMDVAQEQSPSNPQNDESEPAQPCLDSVVECPPVKPAALNESFGSDMSLMDGLCTPKPEDMRIEDEPKDAKLGQEEKLLVISAQPKTPFIHEPLAERDPNVGTRKAPSGEAAKTPAKEVHSRVKSSAPMPPPSLSSLGRFRRPGAPRFKSPAPISDSDRGKPKFLLKKEPLTGQAPTPKPAGQFTSKAAQNASCPPPSTQILLLSHMDDFFPSPSQETREIFDQTRTTVTNQRSGPLTGYNSWKSSPSIEAANNKAAPKVARAEGRPTLRDIDCRKSVGTAGPTHSSNGAAWTTIEKPALTKDQPSADLFAMPFLATQDLMLSSQDLEEIGVDKPSPCKVPTSEETGASVRPASNIEGNEATPQEPIKRNAEPAGPGLVNRHDELTMSKIGTEAKSELKRETNHFSSQAWQWLDQCSPEPEEEGMSTPPPKKRKVGVEASNDPHIQCRDIIENRNSFSPTSKRSRIEDAKKPHTSRPNTSDVQPIGPKVKRQSIRRPDQPKAATAPRPSPKPFFTSSCKEGMYKLALERSKTSAWEGPQGRRAADASMGHIRRCEQERLEQLMLEKPSDYERDMAVPGAKSPSVAEMAPIACEETTARGGSNEQLCCSTPTPESSSEQSRIQSRRRPGNEQKTRTTRLESSPYEKMLQAAGLNQPQEKTAMLQKTSGPARVPSEPSNQELKENLIPASQETDYGDTELEDEFFGMF